MGWLPPTSDKAGTRPRPLIPNALLAVLILIGTEVMFFAGLISAFVIARSGIPLGIWPPPGQPRLPIGATAVNTGALLASALCLFLARRAFSSKSPKGAATKLYLFAMLLGAYFLLAQGREWVALIAQGLTLTSTIHGSFFYTIVGAHGIHVLGALFALLVGFAKLSRSRLDGDTFSALATFWYFVAGIWPILYYEVYL